MTYRFGTKVAVAVVMVGSMGLLTGPAFAVTPLPSTDAPPTVGGVVQVSTPAQLEYIDQNQATYLGASIELMNDIDLSSASGLYPWVRFGGSGANENPFKGTFNGQGYTVSGWSVDNSSAQFDTAGFFGDTSGTIENLGVDGSVSSPDLVDSRSTSTYVGVLAGAQTGGTIQDSFAAGSVTGGIYTGGLVGLANTGVIDDAYTDVAVTGTGDTSTSSYVGGLVGWSNVSITDSYAEGPVIAPSSSSDVGGFLGAENFGSATDSFFDSQSTGQSSGVGLGSATGVIGATTAMMQSQGTYAPPTTSAPWDFATTWGISPSVNGGLPYLQAFYPAPVNTGGGTTAGDMPEVPFAGVLPALGLAGIGAFRVVRRRRSL